MLAVAAVVVGTFAFARTAKADALSDLNAQVQALLAQIAALQGGSTMGGSMSSGFTFTRDHSMGNSGGEVMEIQKFLNNKGFVIAASGAGSPGMESSYFGAKTQAAVAKFQAANGIAPAAGYWGPKTRAVANSMNVMVSPTPTVYPTVYPTGVGPTPTVVDTTLSGSAGSISVTSTSEDVEDEVFTGTTEKVLGFKVEASGADVRVTNVRVKFTAAGFETAASDRLMDYASEISIWAGGEKIGTMSPSDFTRDSAGIYTASIPVSKTVRMGSANKVVFHVGFTALSSIDSDNDTSANDWKVELVQTRYVDPSGATLTDTTTGISNGTAVSGTPNGVYVSRLSSSSDVKLRMAEGSGNPKATNVKVSTSNATEVTLAEFTIKAEGASMTFDQFKATTTLTNLNAGSVTVDGMNDVVQAFYLYRGTTRVAEISTTGTSGNTIIDTDSTTQQLDFTLDTTESLAQDSTQTYRLVAKVNARTSSTYGNGISIQASTSPAVYNVNAKATSDGKSVTERVGSVTTYVQTLYNEGIQISKVSESFTHNPNATTPASSSGEFKMTIRVANLGSNDVYVPLNTSATTTIDSSFTALTKGAIFTMQDSSAAATSTGSATLTRVSGGTEKTNSVLISGGSSADFAVTITFNPSGTGAAGQWRAQLLAIGHASSDTATAASFVNATPSEDFRTQYFTVND